MVRFGNVIHKIRTKRWKSNRRGVGSWEYRVAGIELRVSSYGYRVASWELRVAGCWVLRLRPDSGLWRTKWVLASPDEAVGEGGVLVGNA